MHGKWGVVGLSESRLLDRTASLGLGIMGIYRRKDWGAIMSFQFRPAIREEVGLLIGLIGPSGGGKTYTGMRLAKGICGDKPFAVIDTEAGRAKHYADLFKFDHGDLKPPFTPDAYAEAIKAADEAGYKAVIVDSCSHEWNGDGGVLDWQENELTRMAGDDYRKRESCKMSSWILSDDSNIALAW